MYIRDTAILKDLRDIPNVIKLLDFYMDFDYLYVVNENNTGYDVFDRLAVKKTYTEKEARDLCKILLQTTQTFQERMLVHRNLKPENLTIRSSKNDTDILIGGFCCAKFMEPGEGLW